MAIEINGDTGISGVNGSATTPAIQGTDTNTGLTFGTDTVGVVTGGTTRTTVDSSGRLLVGTASARSNVNHRGTTGITPTVQFETATGSYAGGLSIINNSSAGYAATLTLGVSHGTAIGSNTIGSNNSQTGTISFSSSDGTNFIDCAQVRAEIDETPGTNDMPGRLIFSTTADGASSPTERMRINRSGFALASNTGAYDESAGNYHQIRTDQSNFTCKVTNTNATNSYGIYIKYDSAKNSTGDEAIYFQDGPSNRFLLKANGGIQNYQANDSNLCDEREKKNIVNLDSTWDCLKHWELKKFHYNEDADDADLRYGVIAQQVALHCPEVISDWVKQKAEDAVLDEDGNVVTPAVEEVVRMGVKEQQMMWMAIKALQEAQTRIEQLETRVAQLEGGTN